MRVFRCKLLMTYYRLGIVKHLFSLIDLDGILKLNGKRLDSPKTNDSKAAAKRQLRHILYKCPRAWPS